MGVWHYTNGSVIERILSEGVIKLATAGIAPPEKGVAWFSTNPVWEPSASRGNMTLKKKEYQPGLVQVATKDVKVEKFDPAWMDKNMGRFRIAISAELGRRTICAGIGEDPEFKVGALLGGHYLFLTNLPPRKMMGIESHGMMLAASNVDGRPIPATFDDGKPVAGAKVG
jgi:tRNA-binding EMAP/Myf-like protein